MNFYAQSALLPDGWAHQVRLCVKDGRFSEVVCDAAAEPQDEKISWVIPGVCNAHSHAFQRALAGHTEQRSPEGRDSFWTWRERMYALAGQTGPAALTAFARQVYCEMLAAGYTSVVEFHYLHRNPASRNGPATADTMFDALAAAADDSGIRLTYVPVHYERAGFAEEQPEPRQAQFHLTIEDFLEHQQRVAASGRVSVGIGAHSLRAVAPASLEKIVAVVEQSEIPMHIHVAEQRREVEQCVAASGLRPAQWLCDHFAVNHRWSLVHATHLDDEEVESVAASGAAVVLCPTTEANLGDGLFRLPEYLEAGGRLAIGSDSHVSINPFEELRWLEYGQRLQQQERNVVFGRQRHVGQALYERAVDGGGVAAGSGPAGIAVGAPADLVVLDPNNSMLIGHDTDTCLDALVFSGYPLPVDRVMSGGTWQVRDGQHRIAPHARAEYAAAVHTIKWSP
ncbi:MAG: formimidoylglutamate deiminase [Pseudomonadota bacterium]